MFDVWKHLGLFIRIVIKNITRIVSIALRRSSGMSILMTDRGDFISIGYTKQRSRYRNVKLCFR